MRDKPNSSWFSRRRTYPIHSGSAPVSARAAGTGAIDAVVLLCVFGFALNAFGVYFIFLGVACFLLIAKMGGEIANIPIDVGLIYLLVFALTYSLAAADGFGQIVIALLFPIGYLVGRLFVTGQHDPDQQLRRLTLALVAGTTAHGALNAVTNLRLYGLAPSDRQLPDFWTGDVLTATLQATLFVPLVGFAYYGLFVRQKRRPVIAALALVGLVIAVLYNLSTASRTIFLVALVTFSGCFLVSLWLTPRARLGVLLLSVGGATVGVYALYSTSFFPLRSILERSALRDRLAQPDTKSLAADPRFPRWRYAVDHFFEHPNGGLHIRAKIGYIHNLWLDTYDVAGMLPFLALMAFTLSSLVVLLRTVRLKEVPVGSRILLVGLFVALLVQFMTEPILEGVPGLFVLYCVLSGAARAREAAPSPTVQEASPPTVGVEP